MPWFEAIARYRLGRAMEEGDHARVDELERAYAIFQRLEASYDLELVRREGAVRRPAGAGSIP
jgi:hypothetical protein